MGAWPSCALPQRPEPCSPLAPTVPTNKPSDGAGGSAGALACIPPGKASRQLGKRQRSALLEDVGNIRDGWGRKRIKDVGNCGVSGSVVLNNDGQLQLANEEPESFLFSCHPMGARSGKMLGPSTNTDNVQGISSFELDGAKHKIFLSHSRAQKDFVEQLCVDLERQGYFFPFFDQRHHSLPKGEDFARLIIEAARLCHVAVIVLSEEFLSSKWPMMELAEFYSAQQGAREGGRKLKMLPLFFKLSIGEVKDEDRWMSIWKQHAKDDLRIDVTKWSGAVKALCKTNGLEFGKIARKEVAYRKCVVESIFKLSPPNLLYGSSKSMVGYDRMCKTMSCKFVKDTNIGTQVLGLYGMVGFGKSTLAKALCDYFHGEFLGKVCHVDLGKGSRERRQEWMLRTLCGFEKNVIDYIGADVEKGLMQMKMCMKREPVFLVLDNITNNYHLLKEAQDYLMVGFHPKSRIMITSSSKAILEDLLPNIESYMPMPHLMANEAKILFLKCAAPMKSICELTSEEQCILQSCIQKCWFESEDGGSYHPLVLSALANFLTRLGRPKENQILVWKDHLEKEMVQVKDVWKSSKDFFDILDLQFNTFDLNEKLLFLDIALYAEYWVEVVSKHYEGDLFNIEVVWLSRLHEETPTTIKRKLLDLRKSGIINFHLPIYLNGYMLRNHGISVPNLYKEFAKWYATEHKMKGLKNAWGVFQTTGISVRGDASVPIKYWSNLMRLRIFDMTLANARLVASKAMQELNNLVVLQLHHCSNTTILNLKGLDCLRHFELVGLTKLVTITLPGNSSTDEYAGMYDSLQHVLLKDLDSLGHMPDFRSCSSLHSIFVVDCLKLRNFKGVECLYLKELRLLGLIPDQFKSLPDFKSLQSLVHLRIGATSYVDYFSVGWIQSTCNGYRNGIWPALKGGGPCARLLKELHLCMYGWNRWVCTSFSHPLNLSIDLDQLLQEKNDI